MTNLKGFPPTNIGGLLYYGKDRPQLPPEGVIIRFRPPSLILDYRRRLLECGYVVNYSPGQLHVFNPPTT